MHRHPTHHATTPPDDFDLSADSPVAPAPGRSAHCPRWLGEHLQAAWVLAAIAPDVPVVAVNVHGYHHGPADAALAYTLAGRAEADALCAAWDVPGPNDGDSWIADTGHAVRQTCVGPVVLYWREVGP